MTRIRAILPFSTCIQFAVGAGGAMLVCSSNQVITSSPSATRAFTSIFSSTCPSPFSPPRASSIPEAVPRAPTKSTSSASRPRTVSKSPASQAVK